MCQRHDRVKFLCGCIKPAKDSQRWTYCPLNPLKSSFKAFMCRRRADSSVLPKELEYMCDHHWNSFMDAKFLAFENQWQPKLAEVDWEVIRWRAMRCVLRAPEEKRTGRWCCGREEEQGHWVFECWLGEKLEIARDEKRRRAIERGEPFEVLWTREEALFATV